jgi:hypothetical protein
MTALDYSFDLESHVMMITVSSVVETNLIRAGSLTNKSLLFVVKKLLFTKKSFI